MKKFFVTIVFALILTVAPAFSQVTCPPGYQIGTINTTYLNCPVLIVFCYSCNLPTGYGMDVKNLTFFVSGGCALSDWFLNEIVPNLMGTFLRERGCVIPCSGDEGAMTATIDYSQCWQYVHQDGAPVGDVQFVPCGDGICRTWWKYCIEMPSGNLRKIFVRKEYVSTGGCTLNIVLPPVPQHGEPPNGYWETDCFMQSPCKE